MTLKIRAICYGLAKLLLWSASLGLLAVVLQFKRTDGSKTFLELLISSDDFTLAAMHALFVLGLVVALRELVTWMFGQSELLQEIFKALHNLFVASLVPAIGNSSRSPGGLDGVGIFRELPKFLILFTGLSVTCLLLVGALYWLVGRLARKPDGNGNIFSRAVATRTLYWLGIFWLAMRWEFFREVARDFRIAVDGQAYAVVMTYVIPLSVAVGFIFLWLTARTPSALRAPVGLVVDGRRNNFPALSWSQEAATNETVASNDSKGRFKVWGGFIVAGALFGLFNGGGLENMIFGALVGTFMGAMGMRGAGTLQFNGQTVQHVPHQSTATDRREEITPMTQRQDCEAFLQAGDGVIYFVIARGDKSKGPLPIVESVPWESFGNFEEGSHKQWFRSRGNASELADWGVIVAQSSDGRVGRVVNVAESVHSHAWLVELLVTLQNTFIVPRDRLLREFREADQKRRVHSAPSELEGQSAVNDAPIRPF
jgi:hypothetical protein